DTSLAYCEDGPSCASLGFTDTISECPGSYVKCPADSTKGKCDFEASPGDLKYSLRTSDHNGWLLCNGRSYSSSQYPELYSAISGSFGSYLPNYSGYFLKAAATSSAYSFKTAQQAGLPNISGRFGLVTNGRNTGWNTSVTNAGAFYRVDGIGDNGADSGNGNGGVGFDASRSNSIYGRSTTVTPQNYSANVFIYAGRKKN
ncbi:MAG: tail fiber protein, partial [Proteobacteria bacterium]|nr:tail fiber protein [Pseudomonadota bacterium]